MFGKLQRNGIYTVSHSPRTSFLLNKAIKMIATISLFMRYRNLVGDWSGVGGVNACVSIG